MRTYLKFVRGLGLSPEHEEKILWKNADRLFHLGLADNATV